MKFLIDCRWSSPPYHLLPLFGDDAMLNLAFECTSLTDENIAGFANFWESNIPKNVYDNALKVTQAVETLKLLEWVDIASYYTVSGGILAHSWKTPGGSWKRREVGRWTPTA